jgi:hypothetical protein
MVKRKKPKGRVKGPMRKVEIEEIEEIKEREENLDYMSTEELVDANPLSEVRLQRH